MGTLWLRSFPASRVKTCEITYSHRNTLIIALESSETVFLTSRNVPDVRVCIPSGSLIEKRRGEFGYHVAGRYQPPTWDDWIPPFILLGIGVVLLVARALLFLRRSDRSSPLRRDVPPSHGS
jgi:hypothetical protein